MAFSCPTSTIIAARLLVGIIIFHCFLLSVTKADLTLKTYNNSALAGTPASIRTSPIPSLSLIPGEFSGELLGTITFVRSGIYEFTCNFSNTATGWVWIDGHQVCTDGNAYEPHPKGSLDNPLKIRRSNQSLPFRAHITAAATTSYYHSADSKGFNDNYCPRIDISCDRISHPAEDDTISLSFRPHQNDSSVVQFHPNLSEAEQRRDQLQRELATGWGNWLHHNMLALVKLPEGLLILPQICRKSTNSCISLAVPDGGHVATRVGLHAWDKSYVQAFVGPMTEKEESRSVNANVSMEYTTFGSHKQHVHLLITPVTCGGEGRDCSEYEVRLQGRYAWFRAGSVTTTAHEKKNSLLFESVGFQNLKIFVSTTTNATTYFTSSGRDGDDDTIIIPLSMAGHAVSISTVENSTEKEIRSLLFKASTRERTRLTKSFGPKADIASAIQAAAMWTLIYSPVENLGAFLPVSRSWTRPGYKTPDWTYTIFDWDNFFASLLSGLGNDKRIAYSNLFQVVKSKTAAGFIPNYASGGWKSQDRTEPPVGAKTVLELYRKFRDKWVVEVVFDDLLDWNDWYTENRILSPVGLVALGSYNAQANISGDPGNPGGVAGGSMQGARFESGLDNSPMYDGKFYDDSSHLMQLYDVGTSSLFVQEAHALAKLAKLIGRPEHLRLQERGSKMAAKIQAHLWDPTEHVFANKFPNGTFSKRISPTSFYPMLAGAASDAQALKMVTKWLLNTSRFCVSPEGDFSNNDESCYWGLPSISADDPAFPQLGYWRGYVWGPMALLTYWGLQMYDHIPKVHQGRTALIKQMEVLMMSQWNANRHICENYNPHKTADTSNGDCSGTNFYHWGALTGLIGIIEDEYYYFNRSIQFDERIDFSV